MPQLRTIACPKCGTERQSKAGDGTRMKCASCGQAFRAPATSASQGGTIATQEGGAASAATAPVKPADPPPPAGGGGAGGVKVTRATKTVVPQAARPRAKASTKKAPAKKAAPGKKAAEPIEPKTSTPAQKAGRRGGLGYYRTGVRRG